MVHRQYSVHAVFYLYVNVLGVWGHHFKRKLYVMHVPPVIHLKCGSSVVFWGAPWASATVHVKLVMAADTQTKPKTEFFGSLLVCGRMCSVIT